MIKATISDQDLERLFSKFDNLHLLIQDQGKKISAVIVEGLTTL